MGFIIEKKASRHIEMKNSLFENSFNDLLCMKTRAKRAYFLRTSKLN